MWQPYKHTLVYIVWIAIVLCSYSLFSQQYVNTLKEAKALRFNQVNKSIALHKKAYLESLEVGDSLQAVDILLDLNFIYTNNADYAQAYETFWQALFITENLKSNEIEADIYLKLGRLYSFFKRKEDAFAYLSKALKLRKKLVEEGKLNSALLTQNYYAFSNTYRELDNPRMSQVYLDSCQIYFKDVPGQINTASLEFERAYVLHKKGNIKEALKIMETIEPWFQKNLPSYLVLIYTYWGDMFFDVLEINKSEEYYNKALTISDTYKSHIDFTPLVYEKLSKLYLSKKNYVLAHKNLKIAKELDAQFFDSRSDKNKVLLEIKDEFRIEKERQERLIQKQRLAQLEQQDEISLLQRIILIGALIFIVSIGLIYFKQMRTKHLAEKQLIQRNKELEIKKTKELLELKNKELATSALQLLEKDEFLKEIKKQLNGEKGAITPSEINKVLKSISHSNKNNWEEFKLRFTAVNEEFYNTVTTRYPKLSQADQKICALIKLNFSSKEMARLLGISVESVHTTRYRLRKKMGLPRSTNLEEFIASL